MILDHLHLFSQRYREPAGDNGSDTSGGEDRGDDFTPTDDDTVKGAEGDDTLKGGDDTAKGAEGEDTAKGAEGEDTAKGAEGEDKPKGKDTRIPISRHTALLNKEREARAEAEKKLAAYEKGNQVAVLNEDIAKLETDITELEKEYAKLVTDGDHEKAAAKMADIRKLDRSIADKKVKFASEVTAAQAVEKVRYDTVVERLEAAYPKINPDHDDFDEETARDVVDLAATYRTSRGLAPAEALQKAAKKLLGSETSKQEHATDVKPRVDPKDAAAEAKRIEEERRKKQVDKNVEAHGKQPPPTAKVGADSDKSGGAISAKDVIKMKYDDFIQLDEATLSRMRGDELV